MTAVFACAESEIHAPPMNWPEAAVWIAIFAMVTLLFLGIFRLLEADR